MAQEFDSDQLQETTQFAKSEAQKLGFSLIGVTSPDPPPHLDVYENWLNQGRHGEMAYLATGRAIRRRANPRELLPGCESILVLGMNYLPKQPSRGGIAAYAVGDDYHDVLTDRLVQLVSLLGGRLGREINTCYYTDTGPLLERELAQRAGLGWIGKNTCLINPEHGSYFFLAEVLLDVPLVPDTPVKTDHCGRCTLCIEACPTDCILPDRTLDATRCISYLTIELKRAVPDELRGLTGEWVFGCDICQQVCPWNLRFAKPSSDRVFQTRPFLRKPRPSDFIKLSIEDYRRELSKSPLKRAKRGGLLRNAALAAANSGDRSSITHLAKVLYEQGDPMPRAHAAWALGRLGEFEVLRTALDTEVDPKVLAEIRSALRAAKIRDDSQGQ
ncbi:MAG: tRNA epoxyqueuosine(34) reductase QueG [Anaerolineales bacterium]